MRGEQMAACRKEWSAKQLATEEDLRGHDAVVLIKRTNNALLRPIRRWGGPIIYDALDFWLQPQDTIGIESSEQARHKFHNHFGRLRPQLVLACTQAMKDDLEPMMPQKVNLLRHHYDPRLVPCEYPSSLVVYAGHLRYMGEDWARVIKAACNRLGVSFRAVGNFKQFCGSDEVIPAHPGIMIAVRAGQHGSWLAKRWKSNVKAATAQGLGVPFLAQKDTAYKETAPDTVWLPKDVPDINKMTKLIREALNKRETTEVDTTYCVENQADKLEKIVEKHLNDR